MIPKYNLARALAFGDGDDRGLELEVSAELRRTLDLPTTHGGVLVPSIFAADGPLNTGEATAGQELVFERAGPFQHALRPRPLLRRLGATVISGIRGGLRVPRVDAGPVITWAPETFTDEVVDDSTLTFGESSPPIKIATATVGMSRQLLAQSRTDPNAERIVRRELERAAAAAVDYAGLAGAGGNEPIGLANLSSVPTVTFAGGSLSRAGLLEMEMEVCEVGAEDEDGAGLAFVTTPQVREGAKQTPVITGSDRFLWDDGQMIDRPAFATPVIPVTDSEEAHSIIYGRWRHLIVCVHAIELLDDPVSHVGRGVVEVTLFAYVSVAAGQPTAFRRATVTL